MTAEDLKAKILNTYVVSCRGVPTANGLSLCEAVSALLTARADGTVDVACPKYLAYNEDKKEFWKSETGNNGTCSASTNGNGTCPYRKIKPDSEI